MKLELVRGCSFCGWGGRELVRWGCWGSITCQHRRVSSSFFIPSTQVVVIEQSVQFVSK